MHRLCARAFSRRRTMICSERVLIELIASKNTCMERVLKTSACIFVYATTVGIGAKGVCNTTTAAPSFDACCLGPYAASTL